MPHLENVNFSTDFYARELGISLILENLFENKSLK